MIISYYIYSVSFIQLMMICMGIVYLLYYTAYKLLQTIIKMDLQRNSKKSCQSNQYRHSNRSSVMSIDRVSDRNPSLGKKMSLINAMDLQISYNNNYSDYQLLQRILTNKFSQYRRSSHKEIQSYNFQPSIEQKDLNRKSNYVIKHECTCTSQECDSHHCACYFTPNQICVIGQCCPKCILLKNQFFKNTKGYKVQKEKEQKDAKVEENSILKLIKQKNCKNMHYLKQIYANEPTITGLIFCTCKKSHCQKKYCLCFENKVKCGQFCSCIQCQNKENHDQDSSYQEQRRWQRYATYQPYEQDPNENKIDHDIEQYIQQQMLAQPEQFNEVMQFQPVNFDQIYTSTHH